MTIHAPLAEPITPARSVPTAAHPADLLRLEVDDIAIDLLTGIYSEETHLPQPLRLSIAVDLDPPAPFTPDTPLAASKNYLDLRDAVLKAIPRGRHFKLIEAIADHVCATLFAGDPRVRRVQVKIIKLAISEDGGAIGMTLGRHRA